MNASDLARQVREAEALVRQLERGVPATPKQSHSVTLRNSHTGNAGKSLIEKIRDDLAETIGNRENLKGQATPIAQSDILEAEYLDGLIDGMCHALGILRQNDGETERRWAEALYRENQKNGERKTQPESESV